MEQRQGGLRQALCIIEVRLGCLSSLTWPTRDRRLMARPWPALARLRARSAVWRQAAISIFGTMKRWC